MKNDLLKDNTTGESKQEQLKNNHDGIFSLIRHIATYILRLIKSPYRKTTISYKQEITKEGDIKTEFKYKKEDGD